MDIQFFKDYKNKFTPKEVAVIGLNGEYTAQWLVKPTNSIQSLSSDIRRENSWLTEHHHGIDYFQGDISLRELQKSLRSLTKSAKTIYVRGKEKWSFLNKICPCEIINLECDVDCPSLNDLPWSDTFCLHHAVKPMYSKYTCALNSVYRIKIWLNSRSSMTGSFLSPLCTYNEQPGDSEKLDADRVSHSGCLSSGSDPQGVDETDRVCS